MDIGGERETHAVMLLFLVKAYLNVRVGVRVAELRSVACHLSVQYRLPSSAVRSQSR